MSDLIIIALIGSIAPILTAISLFSVHHKLDHITILTNSTLTAANNRIEALEKALNTVLANRKDS